MRRQAEALGRLSERVDLSLDDLSAEMRRQGEAERAQARDLARDGAASVALDRAALRNLKKMNERLDNIQR